MACAGGGWRSTAHGLGASMARVHRRVALRPPRGSAANIAELDCAEGGLCLGSRAPSHLCPHRCAGGQCAWLRLAVRLPRMRGACRLTRGHGVVKAAMMVRVGHAPAWSCDAFAVVVEAALVAARGVCSNGELSLVLARGR